MDQNTLVVWTFLLLAYKNGLLDKNLQVLNGILDPNTDLSLVLAAMEDSLSGADRARIDVNVQDKVFPLLQILSDEKFMQGIRILLDILQPALERTVRNAGYDAGVLKEKVDVLIRLATSLKPLSLLMAPAIIDLIIKQKPSWTIRIVLRRMRKKY